MSYCRWSSCNFQSDVYCYAHINGTWATHIAGQRQRKGAVQPDPKLLTTDPERWCRERDAAMEPITLPHAGETFFDPSPAAMRERLLALRGLGYFVPEHALARLADEIAGEP